MWERIESSGVIYNYFIFIGYLKTGGVQRTPSGSATDRPKGQLPVTATRHHGIRQGKPLIYHTKLPRPVTWGLSDPIKPPPTFVRINSLNTRHSHKRTIK